MGFTSSAISDTVSNSIRVLKTYKQTSPTPITYNTALNDIIAKDGIQGILFRGLNTKILSNGLQGILCLVYYGNLVKIIWKKIMSNDINNNNYEIKTRGSIII